MTRLLGTDHRRPTTDDRLRVLLLLAIAMLCAAFPAAARDARFVEALGLSPEEREWLEARGDVPVRLGYDGAWAPVEFLADGRRHDGIAADLVRLLGDRLGLRFEVQPGLTWADCIAKAKAGEIDAFAAINRTPEREGWMRFTRPYLEYGAFIFARADAPLILDLADLDGKRVAVITGYATTELLRANHPKLALEEFSSIESALAAVSLGKADFFVENILSVVTLLDAGRFANVRVAAETPYKFPVHMAVRKEMPELASILDKALGAVPADEMNAIRAKWIRVRLASESEQAKNALLLKMRNRNRQLACIFAIGNIARRSESVGEMLRSAETALPAAFLYSEDVGVRIRLDGEAIATAGFAPRENALRAPIRVEDAERGEIEVVYGRAFPPADVGPFTREEAEFLAGVGELLGEAVGKLEAERRARLWTWAFALGALGLVAAMAALARRTRLHREAQRRLGLEAALNAAHRETDTIINSIPGVVFRLRGETAQDLKFDYISESAYDLFGASPAAIVSEPEKFRELIVPEYLEQLQFEQSNSPISRRDVQFEYTMPGGRRRWIRNQATPVRSLDGSLAWFGVYTDVTQQKELEEQLDEAREKAEGATKAKADFLATMSHEIRTPMNAVINMTALALETQLDRKQRQYLTTAHNAAKGLLSLINDILDFSKIEAGRLTVESIPFDLSQLLEELADTFRDRVIEKHVEFIVFRERTVPRMVEGDPTRIRQVLINLVGNAFKFTHAGEVSLRVTLDGGRIRFAIRDTGIGIPADKVGRLFGAFSQVDGSTTRKYGGTGLGLAICKRLVELMGGSIGVESREGAGSTFSFSLALPPARLSRSEAFGIDQRIASLRVLVVEDNESSRLLLEEVLASFGIACRSVRTAEEGLALLETPGEFDVLITDWQLPGMDGLSACRHVRANPATKSLPIVFVSAFARGNELGELDALGAIRFVPKPLKPSFILDALMELFGLAVRSHAPAAAGRRLNFGGALVLLAEDNEANQFVATELLEAVGVRADIAQNGREAFDKAVAGEHALVFMDVQMPELDGLSATRELRARGFAKPIVAMTANAMRGDEEACREAGMDDYVSKPIDREQLYAALERWLPQAAAEEGAPIPAAKAPLLPASLPGVDLEAARARLGLPDEALLRMLVRFAPGQRHVLEQLKAAVAAGDAAAVRLHAHSLSGAAGNIAALAMQAAAKALEAAGKESRAGDFAALLAALEAEAEKVFAGLDALAPPEAAAPVAKGTMAETLAELANALDSFDLEKINSVAARLDPASVEPGFRDVAARIHRHLESYEHAEAAELVRAAIERTRG